MINVKNLEQDLRNIIAEIVEINPEKVTPEANFVEELGMDSIMALEILAAVEKKYKIKIPEEYVTKITNLKQVNQLIAEILDKTNK